MGHEKYVQNFGRELRSGFWEEGVRGKMILKKILKSYCVALWIPFFWLRIYTSHRLL